MTGSEREGERLDDCRAGVAEDFARYRDYADTFVGFGFPNQVGDLFETLGTVLRTEAAFRGQFLDQRVDAEIDVHLFRRQLLLFDLRDHQLCHMGGFTAAEGNFDCRDMNILGGVFRSSAEKVSGTIWNSIESTPALRILSATAFASLGQLTMTVWWIFQRLWARVPRT